ncbi:HEAT repeat domain-containing protein [Roseiflexus sp. RS-1]|uniref:HEAT repeat domain-containing protein n=1 Tax=Roseiflexus sp. (strain RS-1) TaxID=357808 RepID=UPI0000D7FAA6|nr:HEAT repeat domain-containing protein [Roseiflexus sp. RS-1]ABQ90126.1 PBS lyase HEAT domain protein repeat-containing protein [Roseiflexus sp. RS-1]
MIPPELHQALQRLHDGTDTPADLEAVRAALQTRLITLAPATRTVTVGGNSEGTVIVTGDGNTVQVLHGAAAEKLRQIEIDDLTERYLRAVADDWQYLTITTRGDDRRLPLEGVFFMLQARPRPQPRPTDPPLPDIESTEQRLADAGDLDPRDMLRTADQENDRLSGAPKTAEPPPPVPLDTVMQTDEHLAILGEPGAGKSTALQFIGLCYARAATSQAVEQLTIKRPAIPILLRLQVSASTIVRSTLRTALRAEIQSRLQCQDEDANRLFDAWRQSPGLIILLDGLDEVPAEVRQLVRERIERAARSGIGRVILTSRPAGFLTLGGLQEYTLKPFADTRQEALPYLKGWLRALKPEWQAQVEEKAQSLIEQMQASAALRRLLNNPLLLRLSAQHYAATGAIARSRADLYRQWVEEAWQRARQRGAAEQDKQQYLAALQALAWHMHTGGDSSATALQAALRNAGLAPNDHAAADLLHRLREQTGLLARLSEVDSDRYLFIFSHLTLREYLVATRLYNAWQQNARRTWRFLNLRLHLTEWREPLALLAGLLDEADAGHLLTWIVRARSPEEQYLHRDLLLAAELAIESGYAQVIGVMLVPRLLQVLRGRQVGYSVRESAVEALGRIGDAEAVPGLLEALHDADADVRWAAAAALERIGDAAAVPGLLEALHDADADVRWAAAAALERIGDAAAVPGLLAALRDANAGVRRAAAEMLGQIGDAAAVPGLLHALRDAEARVRKAAAKALGQIGDATAVPGLLHALGDTAWLVRAAAAEALGRIGAPAVPGLLQALGNANANVRQAAAEALGQIGDATAVPGLLHALGDANADVRKEAARALGQIGDAAVALGLLAALRDAEWSVRRAAAAALKQIGTPAVPGLLAALGDANADVRRAAAWALGQIGNAAAVPGLLAALGDADADVRQAAAAALGEIGDAAAVPGLLAALGDADADVRRAAAALGEIGDAAAVPGLLAALGDADEDVREAAAAALGQIGDAAAVPGLLAALRDAYGWVRWAAAKALGEIGAPAVPGLLAALGDADADVRRAAAWALGQIGDATAVPGLLHALGDANADVRKEAARALGQIGDAAVALGLLQALRDADADTCRMVARALGQIGDKAAVPGLLRALRDARVGVRAAAAAALGQIGDVAAVPGLLQALRDADADTCRMVARALGQIGDKVAVPGLLRALCDARVGVRVAAAEALGQIGDAAAVPGLLAALRDADKLVRETTAAALGRIGAPAVPGLLRALVDDDADVRESAAKALGQIGTPAVPGLLHALGDTAWWVRAVAAAALRNLLPNAPPHDRKERRVWQEAMAAMQRTALQRGEYDLLTAILERRAAWQAALDPWQDPLQPLPVPVWQRWVLRIGRGGLVVLLAGLVGVVTVALAGVGDAVMAAVLPVLQVQPWWVSVGLVFGLGALATLLGWLVDAVRKA